MGEGRGADPVTGLCCGGQAQKRCVSGCGVGRGGQASLRVQTNFIRVTIVAGEMRGEERSPTSCPFPACAQSHLGEDLPPSLPFSFCSSPGLGVPCLPLHPHLPSISSRSCRHRGVCPAQPTHSGFVSPASPVPRIKWRKVDGSLSPQWATAEPTLQIPSVSFEDEGTYECEAENSKGRDTVQGRIIVQGTEPGTPSPAFARP